MFVYQPFLGMFYLINLPTMVLVGALMAAALFCYLVFSKISQFHSLLLKIAFHAFLLKTITGTLCVALRVTYSHDCYCPLLPGILLFSGITAAFIGLRMKQVHAETM